MPLPIPRHIKRRLSFKTVGRSHSTPNPNQLETKFEIEPDDIQEAEDGGDEENFEKVKDANETIKPDTSTLKLRYATQLMYSNMSNKRNFWDIDGYETVVNRVEDGYELGLKVRDMLSERADIEKEYANKLKKWKENWENNLRKKPYEHPITSKTWYALLESAEATATLHEKLCGKIISVPVHNLGHWLDETYKVNRINFKIKKSFDEKFEKAQESWKKNLSLLEDSKKNYYTACKKVIQEEKNERNVKLSPKSSENDKQKAEKEFEKKKSQRKIAEDQYKTKLEELKGLQQHYKESMEKIYKEAEQFEEARLIQFGKILSEFNQILADHYTTSTYQNMVKKYAESLSRVDYSKDLDIFSTYCGLKMEHVLPAFEEYKE